MLQAGTIVLVVMTACHQNISRETDACADYPDGKCPAADASNKNTVSKTEDQQAEKDSGTGSAAADLAGSAMRVRIATSLDFKVVDDKNSTLLHWAAARKKNTATIKFLLAQNGIDINLQNTYGNTALHLAVRYGDYGGVQLLLKQPGVNKGLRNKKGDTAHDLAVKLGHSLIAALLAP